MRVPVDGGDITHRMGENAKELIIYNPDGFMSAQIIIQTRETL